MRLLASTDLALRLLMLVGRSDPERLNVEQITRQLGGLSRNHLHKIVQDLVGLGIVRTVRGIGGGVILAKPPGTIRLGKLVRTLEADQAPVECFRSDGGCCALQMSCRLRGMMRSAQDAFYDSLDQHTLADCMAGRWFEALQETPQATRRSVLA